MSTPDINDQLRQTRNALLDPISDIEDVVRLLTLPLELFGLLHESLRSFEPSIRATALTRWLPSLQGAILDRVLVDWNDQLSDAGYPDLIPAYFCPADSSSPDACLVAVSGYSILLAAISRPDKDQEYRKLPQLAISFIVDTLEQLTRRFSVDALHRGVFESRLPEATRQLLWGDCMKNITGVPSRVANFVGSRRETVPELLGPRTYFGFVANGFEMLLFKISTSSHSEQEMRAVTDSVSALLHKLTRVGLFPGEKSDMNFFASALPTMERRLLCPPASELAARAMSYSFIWQRLFSTLTGVDMQQVLRSLLASLKLPESLSPSVSTRQSIKRTALLLRQVFGKFSRDSDANREKWEAIMDVAVLSTRSEWDVAVARAAVCWASDPVAHEPNHAALEALLDRVLALWSDPTFIKFSTRMRHEYITTLLLLTVSALPPHSRGLVSASTSPSFLIGVTQYLETSDPTIRRFGMLVAETLSHAIAEDGKALDFGSDAWAGRDPGAEVCRQIRTLLSAKDIDCEVTYDGAEEVETPEKTSSRFSAASPTAQPLSKPSKPSKEDRAYDSDDSLAGYDSVSASSRAPSPTQSELDEIEKDPTLNNQKKTVKKPVYLPELGLLLQDSKDYDKIKVALNSAVDLIRRKKDYGTELEENATNLTYAVVGLQNDFNLDDFESQQQAVLVALVSCCPQKAAPCIIEQFFHNQYSVAQRTVMLAALGQGARELAGLDPNPSQSRTFPSKMLPPIKHQQYIGAANRSEIEDVARSLTNLVIDKQASEAEDVVPEMTREKHLRIRRTTPRPISELHGPSWQPKPATAFKDIAAEYFVMPLINRFWLYLQNEQTREVRSAASASRYRGAGTGMILSAMMLSRFIATLAVLTHASRHSPAFLAVLAPETLELAATLGTRTMSLSRGSGEESKQQAEVMNSALALSLIVVDISLELDAGRTLALEHARMIVSVQAWARQVFENEEKGLRAEGIGMFEGDELRRTAAALILKLEDLLKRWRGGMILGM